MCELILKPCASHYKNIIMRKTERNCLFGGGHFGLGAMRRLLFTFAAEAPCVPIHNHFFQISYSFLSKHRARPGPLLLVRSAAFTDLLLSHSLRWSEYDLPGCTNSET